MKRVKHVPVRKVGTKPIDTRIKKAKKIPAYSKKITSIRTELSDGCYMVTYYFKRGPYGDFLAEDINSATHFERAVYDRMDRILGSTSGELTDKIRW
jgi:hypothetical protein